jgi:succinate-acetate transporter protein
MCTSFNWLNAKSDQNSTNSDIGIYILCISIFTVLFVTQYALPVCVFEIP